MSHCPTAMSEVHSFINIAGLSPAAGFRAPSRLFVGIFVTIQESRVAWEFSRTMYTRSPRFKRCRHCWI